MARVIGKKSSRVNGCILVAFTMFVLARMVHWLPNDVFGNGIPLWVYTDWLIDYSSGFTRRGLAGELVGAASLVAPPRAIIGTGTWLVFIAVVFGYLRLLTRSIDRLHPLVLAALLFLPSLLPFYLHDNGAFGRKEILGYVILLVHLFVLERYLIVERGDVRRYVRNAVPVLVILLSLHVLIHEASFLLFLPVHLCITSTILRLDPSLGRKNRVLLLAAAYAPVLLVFSFVVLFGRPGYAEAVGICERWELAGALKAGSCTMSGTERMWSLPGALTALPWTFSEAVSLTRSFSAQTTAAWIAVFSLCGFFTISTGRRVTESLAATRQYGSNTPLARRHSMNMAVKYFLFPFIASMPLFIVGLDIGRWFAVLCTNYVMVALSGEVYTAECQHWENEAIETSFAAIPGVKESNCFSPGMVFFLAGTIFFIRIPHACITGFACFGPVGSFVQNVVRMP